MSVAIASAGAWGAGSPGFSPFARKTAGALWLRGETITHTGATSTGWVDKFGNFASCAVAGTAPTYTAASATFGNRPAATFIVTSSQQFTLTTFSIAQPSTSYILFSNSISTANALLCQAPFQIIGSSAGHFYMNAGSSLTSSVSTVGAHAVCAVFNGASSALYVDNSAVAAAGPGAGGANNLASLLIGSGPGQTTGITGDIAEILIVPGADSLSQRAALFASWAMYYQQAWS